MHSFPGARERGILTRMTAARMTGRTTVLCELVLALATSAISLAPVRAQSGAGARNEAPAQRPAAAKPNATQAAAEDKRARAAWKTLSADEQREAVEYLRMECSHARTFQSDVIEFALTLLEGSRASLPEAPAIVWYDPATHAPAQPIARHELRADDAHVAALRKAIDAKIPPRALASGWRYDYGTRALQRTRPLDEPERVFENALAGFSPDFDLAEVLVERALDDGSQQKVLAAFGHAYTDRAGGVYPGITLYDAWTSRAELEMPDVDVLGIVHDVLGEWRRWIAPLPESDHDPLYARIGEMYVAGHRHRALRCALARTFLCGDAVLRDGYQGVLSNFHALWEKHGSTPSALRDALPRPDDVSTFVDDWVAQCKKDKALFQAGLVRQKTLADDARAVRSAVTRMLTDFRAFERLDGRASNVPGGADTTKR